MVIVRDVQRNMCTDTFRKGISGKRPSRVRFPSLCSEQGKVSVWPELSHTIYQKWPATCGKTPPIPQENQCGFVSPSSLTMPGQLLFLARHCCGKPATESGTHHYQYGLLWTPLTKSKIISEGNKRLFSTNRDRHSNRLVILVEC